MPASGGRAPPSPGRWTGRRRPVHPPVEHRYSPRMADAAKREPAAGSGGGPTRIPRLEVERGAPSVQASQTERELRAAKAEIEVKDAYVASLEAELEETLAFLRDKTAYIESLPSVRLKAWMKSLLRRSNQ